MEKIKNKLKKILSFFRRKKLSKRHIKYKDVSIICNCCIGGIMYHDIGLRFLSPTINLYFARHHFIEYVKNITLYTKYGKIVDSGRRERSNGSPICLLVCEGLPSLEIHFLHYTNFEEAKNKWIERSKRINFDKIYLVIEAKDSHEKEFMNEYLSLPYKKIIFTDTNVYSNEEIRCLKFYSQHPKSNVTSIYGLDFRRGFDEFDYINQIFNNDFNRQE